MTRPYGSTPHPLPATLTQIENLRRQRFGWRSIAQALGLGRHIINAHYRPQLPKELRGEPKPLGPDAPKRCVCGLVLQDDEQACALCVLQSAGLVVTYADGWARAVGDWLDGARITG